MKEMKNEVTQNKRKKKEEAGFGNSNVSEPELLQEKNAVAAVILGGHAKKSKKI